MEIDLLKSAIQNVLDLINDVNESAFTTDDLTLGSAVAWTDPDGVNPRNTQLTVTATEASSYTGSVDVRYTRIDLADLLGDGAIDITLTGVDDTLESIRTAIADRLRVRADELVLSVTEVPAPGYGDSVEATVSVADGSLLYVGSVGFTVFPSDDVEAPLSNGIPVVDLYGFDPSAVG